MAEETKLKVGDSVICHSLVIMKDSDGTDIRSTIGKSYKIFGFRRMSDKDHFYIIDDCGIDHYFPIDEYNRWFYNLKEERRKKLKKIQNVESW